jgi:hypothetical protein
MFIRQLGRVNADRKSLTVSRVAGSLGTQRLSFGDMGSLQHHQGAKGHP